MAGRRVHGSPPTLALVFGYFLSLGLTEWNAFRRLYPDSGASRMHKPAMADPCIVADAAARRNSRGIPGFLVWIWLINFQRAWRKEQDTVGRKRVGKKRS